MAGLEVMAVLEAVMLTVVGGSELVVSLVVGKGT